MRVATAYLTAPRRIEVRESDLPDPARDEVQVACRANGICMAEVSIYSGAERGFYPHAAGHEGIGVVTKAGRDVEGLAEGDWVHCRRWSTAENLKAEELTPYHPPPGDPPAFIAEPVSCACVALDAYAVAPGDRVLLMGAGYMGLLNVQALARSPAAEIVVTDLKEPNLALAREYGATETVRVGTPEGDAALDRLRVKPFDLVIEAAGAESALRQAASLVRKGGRLAVFSWHHEPRTVDFGEWHVKGLTALNAGPMIGTDRGIDYFERAIRLLSRGVFDQSRLVTHRHPFSRLEEALELALERPPDYIKGVLVFDA
jgi:threonine dehydrogenase-like Zn-dependent dehydrogenase